MVSASWNTAGYGTKMIDVFSWWGLMTGWKTPDNGLEAWNPWGLKQQSEHHCRERIGYLPRMESEPVPARPKNGELAILSIMMASVFLFMKPDQEIFRGTRQFCFSPQPWPGKGPCPRRKSSHPHFGDHVPLPRPNRY